MSKPKLSDAERAIAKEVFGGDVAKSTKEQEKEAEKNTVRVSFLETPQYIIEEICAQSTAYTARTAHGTRPSFLIYNKQTGEIEEADEFGDPALSDKTYKPIVDDLLNTGTILLPSDAEEYGTTDKLVEEIRNFLSAYFELPKFYEKFLPYLALFYWTYDRFPFVPYLHFVGRTGTGKSTAMEVFGSICYKSIDASGAITMASIFRTASTWRGTLLLDEFNGSGDNYQEMISFLKSGVSNKAVLRVEGDREREVRAYLIKSPKIFTSEDPITDAGLQSRTMVIKMEKNKRKIPLYRLKRYEDDALKLRNKLLMWRFRNLDKIDLSTIEFGFEELAGFDRRVQQVITPIFYFSGEETRTDIMEFAREQQEETFRERREALPGQAFTLIAENYPTQIALKFITAEINKERTGREYSEKKVANVVRKILGFDIQRLGDQKISTVIIDDLDKLRELCIYYGVSFPEERAVSAVSVPSTVESQPYQVEFDIEETLDILE